MEMFVGGVFGLILGLMIRSQKNRMPEEAMLTAAQKAMAGVAADFATLKQIEVIENGFDGMKKDVDLFFETLRKNGVKLSDVNMDGLLIAEPLGKRLGRLCAVSRPALNDLAWAGLMARVLKYPEAYVPKFEVRAMMTVALIPDDAARRAELSETLPDIPATLSMDDQAAFFEGYRDELIRLALVRKRSV